VAQLKDCVCVVPQTDDLIESLAAQLQPVRRMSAPPLRALSWLAVVSAIGLVVIVRYANMSVFMHRMQVPRIALECVGSSLTALTAVFAAFELSVPGRSSRWAWLPLLPFLLWLGASGVGCLHNGSGLHETPGAEGIPCFIFIAGVSVPLALALFWMLRRARPIAPLPVAIFGTLGVAAAAASLLQFFHPFDITVLDLAFHLAAVGFVILIGTSLRRPLLAAQ
jgi:hypothetical protein